MPLQSQTTPAVPQAPGAPSPSGIRAELPDGTRLDVDPARQYEAVRNKRDEIRQSRESVEEKRDEIARELQEPGIAGAVRTGLEARIAQLDARILELDKSLSAAEAEVAAAAGVPGSVVPPPPEPPRDGPPEVVFAIPIVFTIFVLAPMAIAYARRIWKRTGSAVAAIPSALTDRLGRLEHAVDAIAIEVESIGEGQRFMTRIFSEGGRAIGQGAVQPVDQGVRDRVAHPRDT